jgi:Mn2+/Fe2+ NRAMP family transporter
MKISCVLLLALFILGCGGYGNNNSMSSGGGTAATHIDALVPNTATAGSAAFMLTVNGSGFASSSVVYWNGATRPTMFATPKQLTAQISASDIATAGSAQVYVRTSGGIYGGGTNSNTVNFPVN